MAGILIFAETEVGSLHPGFWELLTVGRQLASQLDGKLRVVVSGGDIAAAEEARQSGADQVYLLQDPRLDDPLPDAHLAAFTTVCHELQPALIVMPRSLLGMEVGARLAYRLGVGLAQDAMTLDVADGALTVTRPVFGGAAHATIRLTKVPWIVVPRTGAFSPTEPAAGAQSELVTVQPELPETDLKTACVSHARQQGLTQNLERARVIIAGGRGLGGPEPFRLLHEIADLLDAAVGTSRPPCDSVTPELYIAVGISGAIQHITGCSSSRVIVAINNDPGAPIFRMSTYGIVGDWEEVLPAFCDALAGV
jgi:electron transfer flavoprotein alpha subunit